MGTAVPAVGQYVCTEGRRYWLWVAGAWREMTSREEAELWRWVERRTEGAREFAEAWAQQRGWQA